MRSSTRNLPPFDPEQSFYWGEDGSLVLVFDEGSVLPASYWESGGDHPRPGGAAADGRDVARGKIQGAEDGI